MKMKKFYKYLINVTFQDTNVFGNVYFARYFDWQGKVREEIMKEHYPEIISDLKEGLGFATEYAHIDFKHEAFLFEEIEIRMGLIDLSRSRIEFSFDYYNKNTQQLLALGRQAVIWVNSQHRVSLMPDELYDKIVEIFGEG